MDFESTRIRVCNLSHEWAAETVTIHTGGCNQEFDLTSVCPGFIGSTADGRTTTIGRNGSDYTATLLASALGAAQVLYSTIAIVRLMWLYRLSSTLTWTEFTQQIHASLQGHTLSNACRTMKRFNLPCMGHLCSIPVLSCLLSRLVSQCSCVIHSVQKAVCCTPDGVRLRQSSAGTLITSSVTENATVNSTSLLITHVNSCVGS